MSAYVQFLLLSTMLLAWLWPLLHAEITREPHAPSLLAAAQGENAPEESSSGMPGDEGTRPQLAA